MTRPPEGPPSPAPGRPQPGTATGWGLQPPDPGPGDADGPGGGDGPDRPSGPESPRPAGGGLERSLLIAGTAGLVTVIAVAVLLVVVLGGGDDQPAVREAGGGSSSGAPSSADTDAFLARLPADLTDCAEVPLAGDGDLLAAECGAAATQPGPSGARFYLYPDRETLDGVFSSDVASTGLTEFGDGQDCSTDMGYGSWGSGAAGGLVACTVVDGTVNIAWTDDEFLTEGVVSTPGATQADVATLYAWWTENSFYEG